MRPGREKRRRFAVLDVESVPCVDSLANAPTQARSGHDRPALHRIVAASVLTGWESVGGFHGLDIRTFGEDRQKECEIIGFVDLLLPDPSDPQSRLITFNGAHDLALLRHRAMAGWHFGCRNVAGWCGDPAGVNDDIMLAGRRHAGPFWSLADICAGLGLPLRQGLPGRTVAKLHAEGRFDAIAERNRADVIGTFIAYAHGRSFETGEDVFAASAWSEIAELMRGSAQSDPNIAPISRHFMVSVARQRLIEHRS